MVRNAKVLVSKKIKQASTKMNWSRVEELLAEKLADRVRINLKVREDEDVPEEESGVDEAEFTTEEVQEELDSRELAFFFINRHLNKINKVG
jgi:hypothetical protein